MYLAFDTETTGLPFNNFQIGHPEYPHVVQLGAALYDEKFKEVCFFSTLIQLPDTTVIHPKAFEAHGITKEECNKFGVPFEVALLMLQELVGRSKFQIAHNSAFDKLVIEKTAAIYFDSNPLVYTDVMCTMLALTPIMKLPSKVPNKYKWPKLSEAYKWAFNKEIVGAHNALTDARCCFELFKHINKK